ncbi:MAG: lysostaphin resistance A-like protein [Actinomycetota bacterium]
MPGAAVVLAILGPVTVVAAWLLIRSGRVSLWTVNGSLMPVLGAASLLTGQVQTSRPSLGVGWVLFLGLTAGAGLYAATVAFMAIAGRWPPLARHTASLYENRRDISLSLAIVVSALLVAPGEELLWRGVILHALQEGIGSSPVAPVLAWGAYVAANAVSGSLPIVLGAVVGGAAWTTLASLTGGVAASIVCHMVWTGLMVAFPPVPKTR